MRAKTVITPVWSRQRKMISGRYRSKAIQLIGAFYIKIPCQGHPGGEKKSCKYLTVTRRPRTIFCAKKEMYTTMGV